MIPIQKFQTISLSIKQLPLVEKGQEAVTRTDIIYAKRVVIYNGSFYLASAVHKILSILAIIVSFHANSSSTHEVIDSIHKHIRPILLSHPDSACFLNEKALKLSEEAGYSWGKGYSLFIQGYLKEQENKLNNAMILYLQAIHVLEKLNDSRSKETRVKLLGNCGLILASYHNYNKALEYYDKALLLAKSENLDFRVAQSLYQRSSALYDKNSFPEAIEAATVSLQLSKNKGFEYFEILDLNVLGLIHLKTKNYLQAKKCFQEIIHFDYEQISPVEHLADAYLNLGWIYSLEGNFKRSKEMLEMAISINSNQNNLSQIFESYRDLAEVNLITEDYQQSKIIGLTAEKYYEHTPLKQENYNIYDILRRACHGLNDHEAAEHYAQRYKEESERFFEEQQKTLRLQEQFASDMVLAGFSEELEVDKRADTLQYLLAILGGLFLIILILVPAYVLHVRKSIAKALIDIDLNSSV